MLKRKMLTAAFVVVGLLASLEYESVAQTTPGVTQPSPGAAGQSQTSLSQGDRSFIKEAAQGGMAEVELAQMALKKSSNKTVQLYAQQMINEHTPVNRELMALAQQKGVTPPKAIGPKFEKVRAKLSQLSGANFDRAYMNQAGVKAHAEQADLYQRQAQQGQDPQLKAFAAKVLPAVQKHLQEAQAATDRYSGAPSSSPSPSPSSSPSLSPSSSPLLSPSSSPNQ
jgi:putative membrane protein